MTIIGHKKIIDLLDKSVKESRLAQAYLFCGPESVGKKMAAFYLAGKILGEDRIESNPDLVYLEPEKLEKNGLVKKGEIKIESIRELQKNLGLFSLNGKGKIAVIDDADKMNVSAQNSLLKMLEEPNEKTIIILVTSNEKKLLPTILSRCRRVKFSLVGDKEMAKMISESEKNKEEIIFWSFGRPGIVQKLISDPKELDFMKESFREFKELFSGHAHEKFALAEKLGADAPSLLNKLGIWSALLRVSLLGQNAKIKISPRKSLRILEEIEKSREMINSSNANVKLAMENLFLNF